MKELEFTNVIFDETDFTFRLVKDVEVTRVPIEALTDILACAPESYLPSILEHLAAAFRGRAKYLEILAKEHPESITEATAFVRDGEYYREAKYKYITPPKGREFGLTRFTAYRTQKGKLFREVSRLKEGQPIPEGPMFCDPITFEWIALEEVAESDVAAGDEGLPNAERRRDG